MLREIGDWFAALFLCAAIAVTALGVVEWHVARSEATEASAEAFTVVVDAGHGGSDGGATGTVTGTAEAGLNLCVAERVKTLLEDQGLRVVMTRRDGAALAATKQKDIERRKAIIGEPGIDLVVSIHMNKFTDPAVSGAMTFYQLGSVEGQKLAQKVIGAICAATGRDMRLANPGDYFILRECSCPAVLVECGFLSNAAEEQQLLDPDYLSLLADAIAAGVMDYLR